jgi:putative hydrolase of the HAD superfamily
LYLRSDGYLPSSVSDVLYLGRLARPWRAVLFDYFGTLTHAVQRGPAHRRIAHDLGCPPDDWLASLDATFYQRAVGDLGTPLEALHGIATSLGGRPGTRALRAAYATRVAVVRADGPPRAEAAGVLRALRQRGLRTAVVSDCWYELPHFLPRSPMHALFDAHVYSVEVGRCKPHPWMYLHACARLRVAPDECLYVGDGGSRELTGAAALGMSAVRLDAPDLVRHLSLAPDLGWRGPSVRSLSDVVRLVDTQRVLA